MADDSAPSEGAVLMTQADKTRIAQQWGAQALENIERTFRGTKIPGYVEMLAAASQPAQPAFVWSASVQLSALAAASLVEPAAYLERLRTFANSLRSYWVVRNGISGFATLPVPQPADRYYDDNAWMVLALLDTYSATSDPQYLSWAEDTFRFVLSGEDNQLGGGIYWRESDKPAKNACVAAPAIVGALRLYQLTSRPEYLQAAQRLYAWINSRLLDRDGLYFDNISRDGRVDPSKYSYNSAMMIESNVEFFKVTGRPEYLREAQRIARAAQARWINSQTGAIADDAAFAHLLTESFLVLYDVDHDVQWYTLVQHSLTFVQEQAVDGKGQYGKRWDSNLPTLDGPPRLIDWASAARAYWVVARY